MKEPNTPSILNAKTMKGFYSEEQLMEIVRRRESLHDAMQMYHIEIMHCKVDHYQVIYKGDGIIAKVIYNMDGDMMFGQIMHQGASIKDFNSLKMNDSLDLVREIDPNGIYLFLFTGRGEPRVSEHYTSDGYLVTIQYDQRNHIIQISTELI